MSSRIIFAESLTRAASGALPAAPGEHETAISPDGQMPHQPTQVGKAPTLPRASKQLEDGRMDLVLERQDTILLINSSAESLNSARMTC